MRLSASTIGTYQRLLGNQRVQRSLARPRAHTAPSVGSLHIQRVLSIEVNGGNRNGYTIEATGRPEWDATTKSAFRKYLEKQNYPDLDKAMDKSGKMKPGWSRAHISDWKTVRTVLIKPYQGLSDEGWDKHIHNFQSLGRDDKIQAIKSFITNDLNIQFNRRDDDAFKGLSINQTVLDQSAGAQAEHLEKDILTNYNHMYLPTVTNKTEKEKIKNKVKEWVQQKFFQDASWTDQQIYEAKDKHIKYINDVYGSEIRALNDLQMEFKAWIGHDPKKVAEQEQQRQERRRLKEEQARQEQARQEQEQLEAQEEQARQEWEQLEAKRVQKRQRDKGRKARKHEQEKALQGTTSASQAKKEAPRWWILGVIALLLVMAIAAWQQAQQTTSKP